MKKRKFVISGKGANKVFSYNGERFITASVVGEYVACLRLNSRNLPYGKVEKIPREIIKELT